MAEQEGAAAGPNVQHDEFMREDDDPEASGDEDPDAHSAQGPQPIVEEVEELTVVGVYRQSRERPGPRMTGRWRTVGSGLMALLRPRTLETVRELGSVPCLGGQDLRVNLSISLGL